MVHGLFVEFVAGFPSAKQLNLLVIPTFFRPQKVNCYLSGCQIKAPPPVTNALPAYKYICLPQNFGSVFVGLLSDQEKYVGLQYLEEQ